MTMVEQRSLQKVMKTKKRCKKQPLRLKRRDPSPPPMAVPELLSRLFVSCGDVFKGHGIVPTPSDVHNLCKILDGMIPEDIWLSQDLPFFRNDNPAKSTSRVKCTTIYQCNEFSLSLFFLPATAVIPLHNHPGMTVFSKLLLGTMHIKSYDWVDPISLNDTLSPSQPRLAKMKVDKTFTAPCDTSVLYPTSGGNIHEFRAITPCAVLDVMGPPYSVDDGRDCSYYKVTPYSALSNGETNITKAVEDETYGWLEEIEMPPDSLMDGIEYLGPPVLPKPTG